MQLYRIQHHVTGVKVHGRQNFIFTWNDSLAGDANITINSLVHVIHALSQENGKCPPVLYLQADNSGKDNKNSFVLMFLAWLVQTGVFKKVKLSFLMVGHTHEDVDQMFSRISIHQSQVSSTTLPALHESIASSLTPRPVVKHLTGIFDYKKNLSHCRGVIEGISGPHQFVFKKMDSRVILYYKDWPRELDLVTALDLTDSLPRIVSLSPVTINFKVLGEIEKMNIDLPKWEGAGRLSEEEIGWWRTYLTRMGKISVNIANVLDLSSYSLASVDYEVPPGNLQAAIDQAIEKQEKHTVLKLKKRKKVN